MARKLDRLGARKVAALKKSGRHADGGGLYLSISANGGRRWVFLFRRQGRLREMGLGSAHDVPLATARELARQARGIVARGGDPIIERSQAASAALTFTECAERMIEGQRPGWRNAKHAAQWTSSLTTYAYPTIGKVSISQISISHIMEILEPIWATKTETASRVRGRIEAVLDWAQARGYRSGENPARWRGHLDKLLPKRSKVRAVRHHPALPFTEIAPFMIELDARTGVAARALEFLILTVARTGEAIGARWREIDMQAQTWTVPAARMKAGKEHRVPLSADALAVLAKMESSEPDQIIFKSETTGAALSENAILALLERMKRTNITAHGFRSTFRDWAGETTSFPNHVVEMALAHTIGDKAEAAYRRGDLLQQRRALMQCMGDLRPHDSDSKVIPMARSAAQAN